MLGEQGAAPLGCCSPGRQEGAAKGFGSTAAAQQGEELEELPRKRLSLSTFTTTVFRMAMKYQFVLNVLFLGG